MKKLNKGYKPKKSKVLTSDDVYRFVREAPDESYLLVKVSNNVSLASLLEI